ncbi:transposase [Algoriphagus aquatilis]|uniref:Transposase n=1 Tax=Algoriphagus aquatilis TaxID=490186 RepID=A0ABW0BW00_9BACT
MQKNRKHNFDFRLRIVQEVMQGRHSSESIGKKENISSSLVKRWVAFYRKFGAEGLRANTKRRYTADFRLKIVKTLKAESLSLLRACLRFHVPNEATVLNWVRIYDSKGPKGLKSIQLGRPITMPRKPKRPLTREEQLLEELASLKAENAYLKKLQALIQSENLKEEKRKSSKN